MRPRHHPTPVRFVLLVAAAVALLGPTTFAQETPTPEPPEPGTSRAEIASALQELRQKYGADAVLLQGQLLGSAVRSDSWLEASIGIQGYEERDGKRYLTYKLETGIVFNDTDVPAAVRPRKVWVDVIEASFRSVRHLTVQADGIAVVLGYTHRPYPPGADPRALLAENPGTPETLRCYLALHDIEEFAGTRITGERLAEKSVILVDGAPTKIVWPAPPEAAAVVPR